MKKLPKQENVARNDDEKEEEEEEEKGEDVCQPLVWTFAVGTTLAGIATAILVIFLHGIPALKSANFVATTCRTAKWQSLGSQRCLYDCGNELNRRCSRVFDCTRITVTHNLLNSDRRAMLTWDVDPAEASSCSNYPRCTYRRIDDDYRFVGTEFACFVDPHRPETVCLKRPPDPLPYLLWPSISIACTIAAYLIACFCARRRRRKRRAEEDKSNVVVVITAV